jgi:hypothetical protein
MGIERCMKALMILGAIVGFVIGTGFGLAEGSSWPGILWHGCAAALLAALLSRWWSRVWLGNLHDAIHTRRIMRTSSPADKKAGAKL